MSLFFFNVSNTHTCLIYLPILFYSVEPVATMQFAACIGTIQGPADGM